MEDKLNLVEILKGHEGETFYSPLFGNVTLVDVDIEYKHPIRVETCEESLEIFFANGLYFYYKESECMLFPSKEQRDWNKWIEEQKPKVPKTWSEIERHSTNLLLAMSDLETHAEPITKSALALIKIHQLIEVGYGGNITNEEWSNIEMAKYCIASYEDGDDCMTITDSRITRRQPIAFHTETQAAEFLGYPETPFFKRI